MRWAKALRKLEMEILSQVKRLTGIGNWFCDSHPFWCLRCQMLRYWVKFRKWPDFMLIATNHGSYVWNNTKALVVIKYG